MSSIRRKCMQIGSVIFETVSDGIHKMPRQPVHQNVNWMHWQRLQTSSNSERSHLQSQKAIPVPNKGLSLVASRDGMH